MITSIKYICWPANSAIDGKVVMACFYVYVCIYIHAYMYVYT